MVDHFEMKGNTQIQLRLKYTGHHMYSYLDAVFSKVKYIFYGSNTGMRSTRIEQKLAIVR